MVSPSIVQAAIRRGGYDAFGAPVAISGNVGQPFGFTGREHDLDSGLVYARARYLNPAVGRWDRPDPVTILDASQASKLMRHPLDQNRYAYVAAAPTRFSDPRGLTKLEFQVENDFLIVDPEVPGRSPYMMLATSGVGACINRVACQATKNKGPIPLGFYHLLTSEISNPGPVGDCLRNLLGDWGDWRVPLHPDEGTQTFGRDGFFLHGGQRFGSLGCIDFGGGKYGDAMTNQLLMDLLADPDGIVPLAVVRD